MPSFHARHRSGPRPHAFLPFAVLIMLVLNVVAPPVARADGVIIVEPPTCDPTCPPDEPWLIADGLEVKYHRVDVTIADQVATTRIDQAFHNPNDWVAEGTYIFPIPDSATVSDFVMYVDGQQIEATIKTAEEARAIYDEIVRTLRDPALLEYAGQGAIQASVFPIPPGEDRRIQIEYQQVLPAEAGLLRYVYPLNTERFSAAPLEQVSVRVSVESPSPIRAIYSPSHNIAVDRPDDFRFVAGYEASQVLPTIDFELVYTVSEEAIGANLLSYYDTAAQEGYFLLLAAPGLATNTTAIAKDVVVVLDTSGSMEGEKIVQAKEALSYILGHLNPDDRFNVIEFSTGARLYADELQPASNAQDAIDWTERLQATGGTDINLALLEGMGMVQSGRPTIVVFLTDGLPSEGVTEPAGILANIGAAAPENVRLFAFGVGDDVDTYLLDSLVTNHSGASTYVRPGEPLDEIVSGFWAKVSAPVLTDISLDLGDAQIDEIYPTPLPDMFAGSQMVVTGRYRSGGPVPVTLTGMVDGVERSFTYPNLTLSSAGGDDYLPRLWATRKIGYLLNQIRLNGENPEWIDAIIDLSVRFGIVTPYTSYLITEDDILTADGREAAATQAAADFDEAAALPASGGEAVDRAVGQGAMADAEVAAEPVEEAADVVRIVGSRTFVQQDGVWTDTTFDPSTMTTTKVQFASEDYFALVAMFPELGDAFSLGDRVIAVVNGLAFEVTAEEQPPLDFATIDG